MDAFRQTVLNLWRDGTLFRPSTAWSATKFLIGENGMLWRCTGPLLAYFKRDFHPMQCGDPVLASQWLNTHHASFKVVR